MNQRKVKSLLTRLNRYASTHCATHQDKDGCMITPHEKCVLTFEADRPTANICPYFLKHVLPGNAQLFGEYIEYFPDGHPMKPKKLSADSPHCEECGCPFKRKSNRQKYCGTCSDIVRRRKKAKAQRERRLKRRLG